MVQLSYAINLRPRQYQPAMPKEKSDIVMPLNGLKNKTVQILVFYFHAIKAQPHPSPSRPIAKYINNQLGLTKSKQERSPRQTATT